MMQLGEAEVELLSAVSVVEQQFFRAACFTTPPHRKIARILDELGLVHTSEERKEIQVRLTTPGRAQLALRGIC